MARQFPADDTLYAYGRGQSQAEGLSGVSAAGVFLTRSLLRNGSLLSRRYAGEGLERAEVGFMPRGWRRGR
jgi:hypothetical protein